MTTTVFTNGLVFDGVAGELRELDVVVEGERIVDVSESRIRSSGGDRIDLGGRTLMPGLIDAHVHAYFPDVDAGRGDRLPATAVSHWAARMLHASLMRGFTSVRDTGGGDVGLHLAIERGWLDAPRLFYCGKAISQTGGHGDMRRQGEIEPCGCAHGYEGHLSRTADGADEIRRAVREELRQGASFIKIMGSGGVASPTDPIHAAQYSDEEIRAAVDETERHGAYVTAHVHPDGAVRRAIELGLRCIEHGTMISEDTARLAAERGTAIVPTMAVVMSLAEHGVELGFPEVSLRKLAVVHPIALHGVEVMRRAGVRLGFGTDLIGRLERYQCTEFTIRREVMPAVEILRSATSVNAGIIGAGDRLGRIAPGMLADLIAVDGNPLEDVSLFDEHGSRVRIVMKGGRLYKHAAR
jgi:imidazolonepropionase-like amidohydrolase